MSEELPVYNRACNNIGDPPHAEAYCRVLAMEVERLVTLDIAKKICDHCAAGMPKDYDGHHIYNHYRYELCKAEFIFRKLS